MATIRIASGPQKGVCVGLSPGGIVVVGKGDRATLRVDGDDEISERHFSIAWGVSRVEVLDIESRGGTLVNGHPVSSTTVYRGDVISAGRTRFVVEGDELPGRPESSPQTSTIDSAGLADQEEPLEPPEPPEHRGPPIWEIVHDPSVSVATMLWEHPRDGARLSVIVKATFQIVDEGAVLATKPMPVFREDQPSDVEGMVVLESDMVPFKPATDVVLVGAAHAPAGRSVTELPVIVRVGRLRRAVTVIGDRRWHHHRVGSPTISEPRPFTDMPLTYDRAFGGMDEPSAVYCAENPVGTGIIGQNTRESVDGKRLPNLENPARLVKSWSDRPRPMGFGFCGRGWQPRLAYASRSDARSEDRAPSVVALDERFFNGASPDMQVAGYLRGDEEVELVNVSRRQSRMSFRLPGLRPRITVSHWQVAPEEWLAAHMGDDGELSTEPPIAEKVAKAKLDTLVFLPDEDRFYQVFRAVCPLRSIDTLEVARCTIEIEGTRVR